MAMRNDILNYALESRARSNAKFCTLCALRINLKWEVFNLQSNIKIHPIILCRLESVCKLMRNQINVDYHGRMPYLQLHEINFSLAKISIKSR